MKFLKVLAANKLPFAKYSYMRLTKSVGLVVVGKIFPLFVFYTKRFLPTNSIACTKFFCILISPRFENDMSIIAHEVTHVKQIQRTWMGHCFLYNFNMVYRYESELEAYANQCLHLIFHSHIGLNTVLIDELVVWVTNALYEDMNFSTLLLKDKLIIRKEFTTILVTLLKVHRDLIYQSENE